MGGVFLWPAAFGDEILWERWLLLGLAESGQRAAGDAVVVEITGYGPSGVIYADPGNDPLKK